MFILHVFDFIVVLLTLLIFVQQYAAFQHNCSKHEHPKYPHPQQSVKTLDTVSIYLSNTMDQQGSL